MKTVNIPATKSQTVSNKSSVGKIKDKILVGNDYKCIYYSYLFFDTAIIPSHASVISAALILFKVSDFFNCATKKFSVYPSIKQFSSYTTYENDCPVDLDPALKKDFFPFTSDVAVEIDIKAIVEKWINNTLVNRGIVIKSEHSKPYLSCYTAFGSAYSKDTTLIPIIRVVLKEGACIDWLPKADITYTAAVFPSACR